MASASVSLPNTGNQVKINIVITAVANSIDPIANTSKVKWEAYLSNHLANYFMQHNRDTDYIQVTVNGVQVHKETRVNWTFKTGAGNRLYATGIATIPHNSDGTKTVSASTYYQDGSFGSGTATTSLALTAISRTGPTTSFTLSAPARGQIGISWETNVNVDRVDYQRDTGAWTNIYTTTTAGKTSGTATISGLAANTSYSINLRARASYNAVYTTAGAKTQTTLTAAAANKPTTSSIGQTVATLSWTSTRTVKSVRLYRNNSLVTTLAASESSGSYQFTGLSPSTSYTLGVAVQDYVHGSWSSINNATAITTLTAIKFNATPTAAASSRTAATISWETSENANQIRYQLNGGSWVTAQTSINTTTGSFTLSNLKPGTSYSIILEARATATGGTANSSARTFNTTAHAAKPSSLSSSSATFETITFNWTSTATAVNVEYSTNGTTWVKAGANFSAKTSGSFTVTGLAAGTSYTFYIKVVDAINTSYVDATTQSISVSTKKIAAVPPISDFDIAVGALPSASWTTDSGVSYLLRLQAKNANDAWINIASRTSIGSISLTTANKNTLLSAVPNKLNIPVRYTLESSVGGESETRISAEAKGIVIDKPTLTVSPDLVETATGLVITSGDYQKFFINVSKLQATITSAAAGYGAFLDKYQIRFGNSTIFEEVESATITQIPSAKNLTMVDPINVVGDHSVFLSVTDTRGATTTVKVKDISVYNWSRPQILHFEAIRPSGISISPYLEARIDFYAMQLNGPSDLNAVYTIQYRYKELGAANYGSWVTDPTTPTPIDTAGTNRKHQYLYKYTLSPSIFSANKIYEIEFRLSDKVQKTNYRTRQAILTRSISLLKIIENQIKIGVDFAVEGAHDNGEGASILFLDSITDQQVGKLKTSISTTTKILDIDFDRINFTGDIYEKGSKISTLYVPVTRTINNKALSANISLTAEDVGAVPITRTINSKALSTNISLTAADVGAAASSHTHNYLPLVGGTLTGELNVANTAADKIVLTRPEGDYADKEWRLNMGYGNFNIGESETYGFTFTSGKALVLGGHQSSSEPTHQLITNGQIYVDGRPTSWGNTSGITTAGVNVKMGTSSSATWLLSGASGTTFRAGWQVHDAGSSMRFYLGSNYYSISGDNGVIYHSGTHSFAATSHTHSGDDIKISYGTTVPSTLTRYQIFVKI